ncbi:MAG: hypothetical protein WAZ77_18690 [Candidatus Nitrosopolaris sp.]
MLRINKPQDIGNRTDRSNNSTHMTAVIFAIPQQAFAWNTPSPPQSQ